MNLSTNASDAMPEGGELKISVTSQEVNDAQCGACSRNFSGKFVVVSVADTGTGMSSAVKDRAFDPFFTTKEVGKGTGLGLATAFGVVKGHNGHIICESEPGKGSTFRAYFPAQSQPAGKETPIREAPPPLQGHETILLVDDEEQILNIATAPLVSVGYNVLQAASGERAIELFAKQPQAIDLVIMDLSMPGMGGRKCLEKMLALDPRAKVIISSGYARSWGTGDGLAPKAAALLPKPFSRAEMLAKVRQVLDRR